MTTVVLIDDHAVLLAGLKLLLALESDLEVVGDAGTGEEGVAVSARLHPDVVVTDVALPDIDGVEVARRLRDHLPDTRVLVLTAHDDDRYVLALMDAGASGYVLKNAAGTDLVSAIHTVAAGKPWLQPAIARRLIELQRGTDRDRTGLEVLIEPLTTREMEVLALLAGAASNREIGNMLHISVRTVESHLANIYGKLAARGRTEAMLWAIKEGVVRG